MRKASGRRLAAKARVRLALYLDQGRHAVLIDEEVVDRPATASAVFPGIDFSRLRSSQRRGDSAFV